MYLTQEQLNKEIETALIEQKNNPLRHSGQDAIQVVPVFTFIEGTPSKPIRHIASGRGRLLQQGLISVANLIGCASISSNGGPNHAYAWLNAFAVGSNGIPAIPSIRLGTGTTSTTYNMTQLASILSTAPSSVTGSTSNPSNGVYKITPTATWNAGTIAGSTEITEAGLYAYGEFQQQSFGAGYASCVTDTVGLVDRICSTDDDFTAFEVNASNPLTLYYGIQVSFATPT